MALEELFSQLSLWIRIHKASEYGFNTDPDPQHWILNRTNEFISNTKYK